MRVIKEDELEAHNTATLFGMARGALVGAGAAAVFQLVAPRRFPQIRLWPTSLRTALWVMPMLLGFSLEGERASVGFQKLLGEDEEERQAVLAKHQAWAQQPLGTRVVQLLSENKFSIIGAAWAGSMYGSWKLIDRDPIMTKAQKIVQARMYAQAVTIVLLIGTIYLLVYESKHGMGKDKNPAQEEFIRKLAAAEAKGAAREEAESA